MNGADVKRAVFFNRAVQITMAALVLVVSIIFANGIAAKAADGSETSVNIIDINYGASTVTVAVNAQDTMLYLSNESQKKWEYIPTRIESVRYKTTGSGELVRDANGNLVEAELGDAGRNYRVVVLDISWISFSKNYAISFKGDYSEKPIKAILPKQSTLFKVSYDVYSSTVKFTGVSDGQQIQWRKKEEIGWNNYNATEFAKTLDSLIDNGASLVFRTAPENGTSDENAGKRPSKEVSLSIPKRTVAPTITVDDSRMTIDVKKGLNYRYVDETGRSLSAWTTLTKDEKYPLAQIARGAMYDPSDPSKVLNDVYIQFYQSATSSAQKSKLRTIRIPAQPLLTEADISRENSILKFTGKQSFNMIFKTAGESNILEYCIITDAMQKLGITIDDITNENLKWTAVNSKTAINKSVETDSKLVDNGLIYFRRKAQGKLGDDNYKLASPATQLGIIHYPQGASVENFTLLRTVEGMCKGGNNSLSFSFDSDTNGEIEQIEFRTNGGSAGTAKYTYNVSDNSDVPGAKPYTYSVQLTDLSGVNVTNALLYAYVYFDKTSSFENASIKSDNEKGIGLFIYPGTKVNNPSGETETTEVAMKLFGAGNAAWENYVYENDKIRFDNAFKRVYMSDRVPGTVSEDKADKTQFRFKLDIGSVEIPDISRKSTGTDCAEYATGSAVTVTKLSYDGVNLPYADGYFTVEYYNDTKTVDGKDRDYRVAVVTVNADVIERNTHIDDRDKDTPIYIFLSNGEVIKSGVTLNLQRTATVNGSASFSFTEGTLEAFKTKKTEDGVTSTERNLEAYNKINLDIPSNLGGKSNYEVGISTVTWNGINILYSGQREGNAIKIILDSDLINKIDIGSTSEKHDIIITFTNGYVIDSGIPMTISPAARTTP